MYQLVMRKAPPARGFVVSGMQTAMTQIDQQSVTFHVAAGSQDNFFSPNNSMISADVDVVADVKSGVIAWTGSWQNLPERAR
jgi:hypothetical protein